MKMFYVKFSNKIKKLKNYNYLIHSNIFSKYPPNTAIVHFITQTGWKEENHKIFCESTSLIKRVDENAPLFSLNSATYPEEQKLRNQASLLYVLQAIHGCKWESYLAICSVTPTPNSLALSSGVKGFEPVTIPLNEAYEKKHHVISCIGHIFYGERWQLILSSLEFQRQFGVGLQGYFIHSIREEIFNLLKAYEKAGVVDIRKWNLLDLGSDHKSFNNDPNTGSEWGNHAVALNDCFLKFREAAEFIISWDVDEFLIPKLGKNYYEEFQMLSSRYPQAASFLYDRYTTQFVTTKSPLNFSFVHMLKSAQIIDEQNIHKFVVQPSRVEALWIHWAENVVKDYTQVKVTDNYMLHLRKWKMIDTYDRKWNKKAFKVKNPFKDQIIDLMEMEKIKKFHKSAANFVRKNAMKEFLNLPESLHYYPLLVECFDQMFKVYFSEQVSQACLGQIYCNIPSFTNVSCAIAHKQYAHQSISNTLKVHYPLTDDIIINPNGCKIDVF